MAIPAQLQISPKTDRRGSNRRTLSLGSSLEGTGAEVIVHDVSPTGMLIETAAELAVFDALEIELPEAGSTAALVIWNSGRYYGCEFKKRISQATISAALLRSAPAKTAGSELPLFRTIPLADAPRLEARAAAEVPDEQKASLSVRLRVILGSAIILWALIIWAAESFYRIIR